MASSFHLPTLQSPPLHHKSRFLGTTLPHKQPNHVTSKPIRTTLTAKFNLYEILGGRGLCNGEEGLQQELKKQVVPTNPPSSPDSSPDQGNSAAIIADNDDAFEKELLGLTGGFPGGETGLKKFLEQTPPPPPPSKKAQSDSQGLVALNKKVKPPELPLLLPGMIAIVKNPKNPFYMYCGIVQRITDGKAGVLFEGGNWDRLITFRLEELERREKGPPMVNPKSVILEEMVEES